MRDPAGGSSTLHRAGIPVGEPVVESFGSRVRDEVLTVEAFATLLEAKVVIEDWGSGCRAACT